MSGYNYRDYKKLPVPSDWKGLTRKARLDEIEFAILSILNISKEELIQMMKGRCPGEELGLTVRRLYDKVNPPTARISELTAVRQAERAKAARRVSLKGKSFEKQWAIVKGKARLNAQEAELAKLMGLLPERVLSMVPTAGVRKREVWKDSPALHIRRLYDEHHLHPALTAYWQTRGESPYSKAYERKKQKKAEKRPETSEALSAASEISES